jgi:hypothetical protein
MNKQCSLPIPQVGEFQYFDSVFEVCLQNRRLYLIARLQCIEDPSQPVMMMKKERIKGAQRSQVDTILMGCWKSAWEGGQWDTLHEGRVVWRRGETM